MINHTSFCETFVQLGDPVYTWLAENVFVLTNFKLEAFLQLSKININNQMIMKSCIL